jgi:hypothetical protein
MSSLKQVLNKRSVCDYPFDFQISVRAYDVVAFCDGFGAAVKPPGLFQLPY